MSKEIRFRVKFNLDDFDAENIEITADAVTEVLFKELKGGPSGRSYVEVWEAESDWTPK